MPPPAPYCWVSLMICRTLKVRWETHHRLYYSHRPPFQPGTGPPGPRLSSSRPPFLLDEVWVGHLPSCPKANSEGIALDDQGEDLGLQTTQVAPAEIVLVDLDNSFAPSLSFSGSSQLFLLFGSHYVCYEGSQFPDVHVFSSSVRSSIFGIFFCRCKCR